MRIKKGDTVQVIAGKDRGVRGRVIQAFPDSDELLVEGVNRIKKHTKITQGLRGAKSGGIVTQEAPIHISNAMLVDPETNLATRIRYSRDEEGRKVRISTRTGKEI